MNDCGVSFRLLLLIGLLSCVLCDDSSGQSSMEKLIDGAQPKLVKVFGASAGRVHGYATGLLISEDGSILTISGVFLDGQQVRVLTSDGTEYQASVIRRDREKQVALLKIQAETPDFFPLSETEVGEKGDWVVAICNAFKVADKSEPLSATLGVISLRTTVEARLSKRDVAYRGKLVLIDAITSNPGAGGGAVLTTDGKLVGMIGKIINSSETNTRINYAVPMAQLFRFVEGGDVVATAVPARSTKRADLGIKLFIQGGRNAPAYIDRVVRRSPAAKIKLKPDDLIISLAGTKIGSIRQYDEVLGRLEPDVETVIILKRGTELVRETIIPREKK